MRIVPRCNMPKLTKLWHLYGGEVVSFPLDMDGKREGKVFLVTKPDADGGNSWGESAKDDQVRIVCLKSGAVSFAHVSTRVEVHKGSAVVLDFVEGA